MEPFVCQLREATFANDTIDLRGCSQNFFIELLYGEDTIWTGDNGTHARLDHIPPQGADSVGEADIAFLQGGPDLIETFIVDIVPGDEIHNFGATGVPGVNGDVFRLRVDNITNFSQEIVPNSTGGFDTLVTFTLDAFGITRTQRFVDTVGEFYVDSYQPNVGTDFRMTSAGPIALPDAFDVDSNTPGSFNVLSNDDAFIGTLSATGVGGGGTGSFVTLSSGARASINPDGTLNYDPNGAFGFLQPDQSTTDTFTYTVTDGQGGNAQGTVTVTITNGNSAPIAQDDVINGQEDAAFASSVFAANGNGADTDLDGDTFTVTAVNGSAANVGTQIDLGDGLLTLGADGSLTFVPDQDFAGTETFTYTISDPDGLTDTATVQLIIAETNDDPTAEDDDFAIDAGDTLSGNVSADNGNGADSDPENDDLSFTLLQTTVNGQLTFDTTTGFFFYVPDDGFSGQEIFLYRASDGNGGTDTATVTIDVIETTATYSASIQNDQFSEGGSGDTTTFTFTVTRDGATQGVGTVDYAFSGGAQNPANTSDIAGGAFPSGTLSFDTGETTKTLTITVTDDFVPEQNETIDLTLTNGTNSVGPVVLDPAVATATILNDDVATLVGTDDDDKLKGSDDDEVVFADDGDDKIKTRDGDDIILGGDGDDRINDKGGDNLIFGDDGDDRIKVKDGDNIIDGGAGDDEMTAGKGDDIFVIKQGNDRDEIKKFDKDGRDLIDLSAFEGLTFDIFEDEADEDGKDVVWEAEDGTELVILKFDLDDLSSRDFIFAE